MGRKPRVCVLAVPNHMTYADFCRFCGAFVPHTLEMRIVRTDGAEDQYSVLINFDTQSSTDSFYKHFNGKQFSSLEGGVCHVRFVEEVHYTELIEHAHTSVTNLAEQPTCPVCLERLDQDPGGILTTICNHSFHCSCISKWTDSSCPVCRYCQQQPEKSMCSICGTSENLWICLICGHVGCGRYKGGHAIEHWKETQHCYSLELETQKVWDYAGDNYVHRLIQSKTDGKLVEYNFHGDHTAESTCSLCSGDAAMDEALLNSKFEAIVEEYNDLVTFQLEKQRNYYESLLLEVKEETEKEISAATEKAMSTKLQKLEVKFDKCMEEKKFLDEVNGNLVKNQEMWIETIRKAQAREQAALRLKDEKIEKLQEEYIHVCRYSVFGTIKQLYREFLRLLLMMGDWKHESKCPMFILTSHPLKSLYLVEDLEAPFFFQIWHGMIIIFWKMHLWEYVYCFLFKKEEGTLLYIMQTKIVEICSL
ncbi:hypothetical protein ACJX0J_024815, partial [Zea mays]